MANKKNGFSLVELLIVLGLIGLIVAMTVNFSVHNRFRWSLRDTSRELTSTYYQAKQRAARENSSIRLEVTATGYTLYRNNAGAWTAIKNEIFPEKISATLVSDFKINPMGFILNPGIADNTMVAGTQVITLITPRGADVDSMTITIYPYGGLRVQKVFK
jgi:prepilin-type N-terminal cleavage/methylation domain-containing protein